MQLRPFLLVLALAGTNASAAPTTFGTEIGHPLLCLTQLNSNYFYDYLRTFFGQPYKHEQGAYWFKTDGQLWDARISEVLVGDLSSQVEFIAAVVDTTPSALAESIRKRHGVTYRPIYDDGITGPNKGPYFVLEAHTGGRIIYYDRKTKIYCAKSQLLLNPDTWPRPLRPLPPQRQQQLQQQQLQQR